MIVDAGPLLALFNPADRDHQRCVAFLRSNQLALVTTWPVLTEVMHLLRYSVDAQLRLLSWIDRGADLLWPSSSRAASVPSPA